MCNISDGHFLTANMQVYHHLYVQVTIGAKDYWLILAEVAQKGPFLSMCDLPT